MHMCVQLRLRIFAGSVCTDLYKISNGYHSPQADEPYITSLMTALTNRGPLVYRVNTTQYPSV